MSDALSAVLADALPHTHSGYIIGEPSSVGSDVETSYTRVSSPDDLSEGADVIVAGPNWEAAYSGSQYDNFATRLQHLNSFLNPGGSLVLVLNNAHSTSELLQPSPTTHPSWDVDGVGYDATRPGSPAQLLATLAALGHSASTVHEVFGSHERWCVLSHHAEGMATRYDILRTAVSEAITPADASPVMPADVLVDRLAGSGALHTAANSFIAVVGGRGRSLYRKGDDGVVSWLDGSPQDSRWAVGGGSTDDSAGRPLQVPVSRSAATKLLTAIATGDTASFRSLALNVASWVRQSSQLDGATTLDFRNVYPDGERFALVLNGSRPRHDDQFIDDEQTGPDRLQLLTQAWRTFAAYAHAREPQMPWPATFSDDELLRVWLSMSDVSAEEAEALISGSTSSGDVPETNYAQEFAVRLNSEKVAALQAEVAALQGTLRARDEELGIRARVIRSLRRQVLTVTNDRAKMEQANKDIKGSQAFRLANQFRRAAMITRPKKLVRAVGKRAENKLRQVRRVQ